MRWLDGGLLLLATPPVPAGGSLLPVSRRCRLGIHTPERSQGLVGYCLRGCGDLKRVHTGPYGWMRYTVRPSADRPPPPGLPRRRKP